jgi:hypothetical protein
VWTVAIKGGDVVRWCYGPPLASRTAGPRLPLVYESPQRAAVRYLICDLFNFVGGVVFDESWRVSWYR